MTKKLRNFESKSRSLNLFKFYRGDLEFDEATDLQIDLILAEMTVRGRGGGGSNTQKVSFCRFVVYDNILIAYQQAEEEERKAASSTFEIRRARAQFA